MSKAAKQRREQLFRNGKPHIRPVSYEDIRWLWAAARREQFDGTAEEFTQRIEPYLASADKLFMIEDKNSEFKEGSGPVGIVLANYDGWSLIPHVHWMPWASSRNILRGTVGFLQAMKYTHDVGSIKIFAEADTAKWFKWLRRYLVIRLVGKIPAGRESGEEFIFYIRGRKQHGQRNQDTVRRGQDKIGSHPDHIPQTAGSTANA